MRKTNHLTWLSAALLSFIACGGGSKDNGEEPASVTTEHCSFEPVPENANATGTVESGTLQAGAAEAIIDIPISTALGGYTARAGFLGQSGVVDTRDVDIADAFNESIGVESAPRIKVVVLTAGGETIVLVKIDAIFPYEGMTFDVAEELGPEYRGKVLISASHTHSGWAQFTGHTAYQVGAGRPRNLVYRRYVDTIVNTANRALANRRDARLGVLADQNFDPADEINRDRRGENNMLPGGAGDDKNFFLVRIDGTDDLPIAIIPIYGIHGTLMDEDNSFASTDATGAMERVLEERFDSEVVVMHLQGAAGDVSPKGHGAIDCDSSPSGDEDDPCWTWLQGEGHGRVAADAVYAAWQAAGESMQSELALEMVTRSIELGPKAETFNVRDGALAYAPFEYDRVSDGEIWSGDSIISPIDEFNAPVGAALCEEEFPIFPDGLMPGTDGIWGYGSCVRMDTGGDILGQLLHLDFETSRTQPICQSTRTVVSAMRIGDYVIGTIPGELTVMLAGHIRDLSPADPDKTIVLGYSQGFTGYSLMAEDWLQGGFESSTNIWGPLEAEYVAENTLKLMDLALTPERDDGSLLGADRVSTFAVTDDMPIDDPAPQAGVVLDELPERVWLRTGPRTATQPDALIPRVSGLAQFSWVGDDPQSVTPLVTLEREVSAGNWQPVTRRSGRIVRDSELLLMYTPLPLKRDPGQPQTHHFSVEWQAVPWLGADNDGGLPIDGLDGVCAVPLGMYRFHVVGKSYDITSNPFEVIPGDLSVIATRNGSSFDVSAGVFAEKGYRLLDMEMPSNHRVPLRSAAVTVELLRDGMAPISESKTLGIDGTVSINAGSEADNVIGVRVTDVFGNVGERML